MKKLFTFLVLIALSVSVFTQAPQKMSYQAVIRNSSGQLVVSHAVGMRIRILQGSATGTAVYVETQSPATNANGLATIEIGGGTVVTGTFSGINWATGVYFIKTETDPIGGTNYTVTGTSQILSVPYALYAKKAKTADYNDLTNKPTILEGTVSGQMQYWNGTAWVTVAAGLNGQILKYKNGVPTWADGNINDLSIGDSYQGGVISYFLVSGDPGYDANVRHGLIAAPIDQSTAIQWGSISITGATATAIGTGNANTNTIVANQGAGSYAAILCADLVLGGYSDWYLPSKDELNKLYLNKSVVGGFANNYYWSSSERSDGNAAWSQHFDIGNQYDGFSKANPCYVRAVRAF